MIENRAGAWTAVLVGALAGSIGGCRQGSTVPEGFQGLVEYDERIVGFEQPGRVTEVPVQRGQLVRAGQVLAKLDDALQRATRDARRSEAAATRAELALLRAGTRAEDVAAATADANAAAANEELLRKSAERARKLLAEGAISKAELDKADADLEEATGRRRSLESRLMALRRGSRPEELARAEANVDQQTSALDLEEERLARFVLRAQTSGEITDVTVKPGEFAAVGTPAVTLADVEHPYADVFVPEGQLDGVRVGADAVVRVDATSEPFHAVVEYVSPETEFTPKFLFSDRERPNLVVRARVRIDDARHRLHSGIPAFVTIRR
ncbi:MAG TPA: HlyD family efflux transporter periplasmic adaptor subunit [Polyangiaceae bacterium]|nr:HlyD family efflux transporter periplasmic adaptor subunit [Polyangiaceae bacterium]